MVERFERKEKCLFHSETTEKLVKSFTKAKDVLAAASRVSEAKHREHQSNQTLTYSTAFSGTT